MLEIKYNNKTYKITRNLCKKHNKPMGFGFAKGLCLDCIKDINREFHKK